MKNDSVAKEIPRNEDIIFIGHKSAIGLAALVGDSVLYASIMAVACLDLYKITGHDVFLAALVFELLPIWYGVYGVLLWKAEVHVVTSFSEKEGGIYRKFSGPFSTKIDETSITRATPDIPRETSFALRLWKGITGQDVTKITLRSDGNTVITSDLVPTRLYKVIAELKGEPTRRRSKDHSRVYDIAGAIRMSYHDGIIGRSKATNLMEALLEGEV